MAINITMKRSLSMLLAVLMLVSMFPVSVFAEDGAATTITSGRQSAPPAAFFVADQTHFEDYGNETFDGTDTLGKTGKGYYITANEGTITVPDAPEGKDGYVFAGWAYADDPDNTILENVTAGASINVTESVVYSAVWKTWTVDFVVGTRTVLTKKVDVKVDDGGNEAGILGSLPEAPSKANYKFKGWFPAEDVEETQKASEDTSVTDDMTLVAAYTPYGDLAVTDLDGVTGTLYVIDSQNVALMAESHKANRLKAVVFNPNASQPNDGTITEWTFIQGDEDGRYAIKALGKESDTYLNLNKENLSIGGTPQYFYILKDIKGALRIQTVASYEGSNSYAVNLKNTTEGFKGSNWWSTRTDYSQEKGFAPVEGFYIIHLNLSELTVTQEIIDEDDLLTADEKNAITYTVTGPNGFIQTFAYGDMTNGSYTLTDIAEGEYTVTQSNAEAEGMRMMAFSTPSDRKVTISNNTPNGRSATVSFTNIYKFHNETVIDNPDADDPLGLDGQSYYLATWAVNNSTIDKSDRYSALTAEVQSEGRLKAVLCGGDESTLYWLENTPISKWTFDYLGDDIYSVRAENGKYLSITENNQVTLDEFPVGVKITVKNGLLALQDESGKYAVNNYNLRTEEGFGSSNYTGAANELFYRFTDLTNNIVRFDVRGGGVVQENISAGIGETITLPSYSGTKANRIFLGWTEINYAEDARNGGGDNVFPVFYPGDSYTVTKNPTILYAAWVKDTDIVKFCIQKQGIAKEEPSKYDAGGYWHFNNYRSEILKKNQYKDGAAGTKELVIDYYYDSNYENEVSKSLAFVPSGADILAALQMEPDFKPGDFDPETQFVLWYVKKSNGDGTWHVDGVIRTKGESSLIVTATNNLTTYNGRPQGLNVEPQVNISDGTTIYYSTKENAPEEEWTTDLESLKWTDCGTYTIYIKAVNPVYGTATTTAKVEINRAKLTITANDQNYDYNGWPQGETGVTYYDAETIAAKVTVEGLQGGDTLSSIKLEGNKTDAGTYEKEIKASAAGIAFNHETNKTITHNYSVVYVPGKLTIDKSLLSFAVNLEDDIVLYDGQDHALPDAATSDAKTGTTTILYSKDNSDWTENLSSLTWKDAGVYTVYVKATNPNYNNAATDTATLTINRRNVTLTSASATKEWDGSALTNSEVSVSGDGFVSGEGATFNVTGSQTVAGSSSNSFTYTLNSNTYSKNYNISVVTGTLKVTNKTVKYEVEVKAKSDTYVYDGMLHTVTGFETEEIPEKGIPVSVGGNTYYVTGLTASASAVNRGDVEVCITGTPKVEDINGNDVTAEFTVTLTSGTLTINPRPVTLKSADVSRMYNSRPLTNAEAENVKENGMYVEEGWVEGQGATYNFFNSITLPGYIPNDFDYTLLDGTLATNYTITKQLGQLSVVNRNPKYEVVITTNSASVEYDGKVHTVYGFVGQNEAGGVPVTIEDHTYYVWGLGASASGKDARTYDVQISGSFRVTDGPTSDSNDVTQSFNVKINKGSLSITKKDVTLVSATLSREFTGEPLTNGEAAELGISVNENGLISESGWADGEGANYSFTGSVTLPGKTTDNAFIYTPKGSTNFDNYNITTRFGSLTIDNSNAQDINIKVNSLQVTYDGKVHSVEGFEGQEPDGRIPVVVNGHTYYVSGLTASARGTNVSESKAAINAEGTAVVTDAEGHDVSSAFNVKVTPGSLMINRAVVTLVSAEKTKRYDGKALKNDNEPLKTESGFAEGEGAIYNFTGSQTLVGQSSNAFSYTLKDGTVADNYIIKKSEGLLIVTSRDAKYEITVVANSSSTIYDGTEKSVEGFNTLTFTVEGNTYTVEGLSAAVTAINAGTYPNTVTGTAIVKDSNGNDVTNQFTVKTTDGLLTINPKAVTVTAKSENFTYDGAAHSNSGYDVVG